MKHIGLFAIFIPLTLTLSLTRAYATTITVGNGPEGVAFDPHPNEVFVANSGSGTVSVIPEETENFA